MTERGTVTQIKGRQLTVQLEFNGNCGACANEGCKQSRQSLQAWNRHEVAVSEGDLVEIEVEGKAQLAGAFWVLAMPLALFGAGYAAARALWPPAAGALAAGSSAMAGEGPAALGGLAGLAIGILIGVAVQKGKRVDSLPFVVRKLEAREPDEDEVAAAEESARFAGVEG
jgi:positive regulator of sigma E activity